MKERFWLVMLLLVCQIAVILAPMRALWAILGGNYERAFELMKAYDRLGNAVTNGRSTDYISTRANIARKEGRRWGCVLCGILDKIEKDHCANSPRTVEEAIAREAERAQLSITDPL